MRAPSKGTGCLSEPHEAKVDRVTREWVGRDRSQIVLASQECPGSMERSQEVGAESDSITLPISVPYSDSHEGWHDEVRKGGSH